MFADRNIQRSNVTELERIENDLRKTYGVEDSQIVLVTEEPTRLPGGPKQMTTILFWIKEDRHKLRIFKPATEIMIADLPPMWVRGALLDEGDADCC